MGTARPQLCRGNRTADFPIRQGAKLVLAILSLSTAHTGSNASQDEAAVQTIVFIRHGEKPEGGFDSLPAKV